MEKQNQKAKLIGRGPTDNPPHPLPLPEPLPVPKPLQNLLENKEPLQTDLLNILPPSLRSLFKQFMEETKKQSSLFVSLVVSSKAFLLNLAQLEVFAKLVLKIQEIKEPHGKDPLDDLLEDIKELGRVILYLDQDHPSIITTIITKALQPTEEKSYRREDTSIDNNGFIKVDPKPVKGFISEFIDWAIDLLLKFLNYKNCSSPFLEDNFAPVNHETPPTADVLIKGQIPMSMNGMMIRNGPNPQFVPIAHYEWVDGDSMLHAIYFKEGKATYTSRYVKTSRFKQEKIFGRAEFLQYGDLKGSFGVFMACIQLLKQKLGILDMSQGWFNANDGSVYHSGVLTSFEDFDKPYAINVLEDGDLETLGINDYNDKLTHNFVAHPKKDSNTGEMFILGSSYTSPYAIYNIVTKDGNLGDSVCITTSGPTYMHDFAITKTYVIFMDLSFCFNPENMAKNDEWVYNYDRHKNAQFGILPRYEKNEKNIKWFEFNQPFFIFHNANAWEEDKDTIILISCLMEESKQNDSMTSQKNFEAERKSFVFYHPENVYNGFSNQKKSLNPQGESEDDGGKHVELAFPTLNKLSFNMKTGKCTRTQLTKTSCDYPKVNESFIGRSSRFVYTSEFNKANKIIGIVKYDLEWESELKLNLGEGKYSSEVTFVSQQSATTCEEDDGYLTTFVYDEIISKSYAYVICAKKMEILATVELKNVRVPYGFHATFITEEEIKEQKTRIKSSIQ